MRTSTHTLIRRATRGVALIFLTLAALGATKGPDAGGYTATDSVVFGLVDLSGASGGASVLSGIDDGVAALTIPFPFRFYGQPYTIVCASANGALYFVTSATACSGINDFANVDLTSATTPKDLPAALPFWSDLTFQVPGAGSVIYQTIGVPGSRRFIVQWNNAYPQGSPNPVTFQIVLAEGLHTLLFQYKSVALGDTNPATKGGDATVGIRNASALSNQQQISWSFDAPVIPDSSALQFTVTIVKLTGDVDSDGLVNCTDLAIVKAAFGKRRGQVGYDARADLNNDGIVNLLDLTIVSRALPAGTKCP